MTFFFTIMDTITFQKIDFTAESPCMFMFIHDGRKNIMVKCPFPFLFCRSW